MADSIPKDPIKFIKSLQFEQIPADVVHSMKRCLLDTIGVAAAGRHTPCAQMTAEFVAENYANYQDTPKKNGNSYGVFFDDLKTSLPGALLANAMMIDSFDAHDTDCETKGHIGVGVVPAAVAIAQEMSQKGTPLNGKEFLTTLTVGYEISRRASLSLHASVADYHTSGAWLPIGVAAVMGRHRLSEEVLDEAMGIAEFYGPRSQMLRDIEYPTMVKDGSGWGAMVGASAVLLAEKGFTGSPAITVFPDKMEKVFEGTSAKPRKIWSDLGEAWAAGIQDFKAYPVCYWAQSAMASLRGIQSTYPADSIERLKDPANVDVIEVFAYLNAVKLRMANPETTDAAQYSVPFPVACLAVLGKCGVAEVTSPKMFRDPTLLAMSAKVQLILQPEYEAIYPVKFYSRVRVVLKPAKEGDEKVVLEGDVMEPWGKHDGTPGPLTDEEVIQKAEGYMDSQIKDSGVIKKLVSDIWGVADATDAYEALKAAFCSYK